IQDIKDTSPPLGFLPGNFGNMSFDACRGLAYMYGFEGQFHIIDFNDPTKPKELNDPGSGGVAFSVQGLGQSLSFNGNANQDGTVILAGENGIAVIQVGRVGSGGGCGGTSSSKPGTISETDIGVGGHFRFF